MPEKDVRWIQPFRNYVKAFGQLSRFIEKKELNELAWNTIKDYFENQGETGIHGSRDAFRLAFQ